MTFALSPLARSDRQPNREYEQSNQHLPIIESAFLKHTRTDSEQQHWLCRWLWLQVYRANFGLAIIRRVRQLLFHHGTFDFRIEIFASQFPVYETIHPSVAG